MSIRPFLAALALLAVLTGCTEKTQQEVSDTATTVAGEVRDSAESAAESVGEAAESAGEAIQETGVAAGVAAEVKTALMVSEQVETSQLNVDVEGETVFLRGTVPAEEQVALAEQIAADTVAEGTTVTNELTVATEDDHDHDDPDHTHDADQG